MVELMDDREYGFWLKIQDAKVGSIVKKSGLSLTEEQMSKLEAELSEVIKRLAPPDTFVIHMKFRIWGERIQ